MAFNVSAVIASVLATVAVTLVVVHVGTHPANLRSIQPSRVILRSSRFAYPKQQSSPCAGHRLAFWSSDLHITPPADLKDVLARLSQDPALPHMSVIDKSRSGHCNLTHTCATDLRVLTQFNMVTGLTCDQKEAFWRAYARDPFMEAVDAFFVSYAMPSSLAFLPFNRPILMLLTIRYEVSVLAREKWAAFTQQLAQLGALHPRFVIAANNQYDLKYVQYFTGLDDTQVVYLPSYCYVKEVYAPVANHPILIAPRRVSVPSIIDNIVAAFNSSGDQQAVWMADAYPHYEFSDLVAHPAIVFIPYTVSVMSFFEFYRMNIPLLVPSKRLLAEWHARHTVLPEMTWPSPPGAGSPLPPHPRYAHWPDPNNDTDPHSFEFWVKHADFYTFDHVLTFDSVEELVTVVNDMTARDGWRDVSKSMALFNKRHLNDILTTWKQVVLPRMFGQACHSRARDDMLDATYSQAASAAYAGVSIGC